MSDLIFRKEMDWSVLSSGFTLPHEFEDWFLMGLDKPLEKGESREIYFVFNGKSFKAKVVHVNFSVAKRVNTKSYQIKYASNGDLSKELQKVFSFSYEIIQELRENPESGGKRIKLPDGLKEYLSFYVTNQDDVFILGKDDEKAECPDDFEAVRINSLPAKLRSNGIRNK